MHQRIMKANSEKHVRARLLLASCSTSVRPYAGVSQVISSASQAASKLKLG